VFVVSNPVDILTQLAAAKLSLPWQQVLGLGTMLDTARFRSLIAQELKLAPTQVKALIPLLRRAASSAIDVSRCEGAKGTVLAIRTTHAPRGGKLPS